MIPVINAKQAVKYSLLIWFALTPLFWHFDLSKGSVGFYDILTLAPFSVVHAAIFFSLMFVSLCLQECSLFHILLITFYYPLIMLTNYPSFTFRDVFLHGAPTKTILEDGILNYTRDLWPGSWPSSFVLWAMVAIVTQTDLVAANYILFFVLITLLALVTFSLARSFKNQGYLLASISALLFLGLFRNSEFALTHFSRASYTLILILFFLLLFSSFKSRRGTLLCIIVSIGLIVAHPQQSFFVVLFLVSYLILNFIYKKPLRKEFIFFYIMTFISWMMISAGNTTLSVYDWIKGAFSPKYWAPISATISSSNSIPVWGIVLKNYYVSILVLSLLISIVASVALIIRNKKRKTIISPTVILFSSFSLAIGCFFLVLSLMPEWSVMRFSAFAAFSAFPSIIFLNMLIKKREKRFLKIKQLKIILLIIVITLSFVSLIFRFQPNIFVGELSHQSEFSTLTHLYLYCNHPLSVTMTYRTCLYYYYYDYHSQDKISYFNMHIPASNMGNQTAFMLSINKTITESSYIIRGARDEVDLSEQSSYSIDSSRIFEKVDSELISQQSSLIYSNGNYSMYVRTNMGR